MDSDTIENKEFLYVRIAQDIEQQIMDGVLKMGDKLPSIRILKQEYGVSPGTVLQAYYNLEAKSLVRPRPKSGYYVIYSLDSVPLCPIKSNPKQDSVLGSVTELIYDFYGDSQQYKGVNFSLGLPSPELLPIAKLNKVMHETVAKLPSGGTSYGSILGSPDLRRQIARRSVLYGASLTEDDLVITAGCTSALSLSLMAVTKAGDTIAVESPVYFGLLQLANTLGLRVIELPTDPVSGMDLEALKEALSVNEIKAVAVISNFNNPMGTIMSDESKRALVRIVQRYEVPLIEDDIYGDIYFGKSRPTTCKTFDDSGLVMLCGSFSKTLAGGYRIGWVAPGKFKAKVLKLKLYLSATTTTITEEALATFLEKGRYDYHLRKLRQTLYANSLKHIDAIGRYFPADTRVSKPKGSFLLWVELNHKVDTRTLYERAGALQIKFSPGRIFTLQNQYNNCLRISCGMVWNDSVDGALQKLGQLVKELSR